MAKSSISSTPESIFPLPLTPFESYLLVDDSPAYPMVFRVELQFGGAVDPDAFRRALETAIDRNPLLRATVSRVDGRDSWTLQPTSDLDVVWSASPSETVQAGPKYIDLRRETGFRC